MSIILTDRACCGLLPTLNRAFSYQTFVDSHPLLLPMNAAKFGHWMIENLSIKLWCLNEVWEKKYSSLNEHEKIHQILTKPSSPSCGEIVDALPY